MIPTYKPLHVPALLSVTLPPTKRTPTGATFGITVDGTIVTGAAPIGSWMVPKYWWRVVEWVKAKGGTVEVAMMMDGERDPFKRAINEALVKQQIEEV